MRRDLACAALGLAVAIAYWIAASRLQRSFLSDEVGADGVPKGLAVLLAIFSLTIAIRALLRKPDPQEKKNHLRALGIALLGVIYIGAAPYIGYFISIVLLAGAAALYYGAPRRPVVALFALGTAAVLWLAFGAMLGIHLP